MSFIDLSEEKSQMNQTGINYVDESISSDDLFNILKSYRKKYLNRELKKETYRDLLTGKYRIGNYTFDDISDDMIESVDISQNYINFLIPLFRLLI